MLTSVDLFSQVRSNKADIVAINTVVVSALIQYLVFLQYNIILDYRESFVDLYALITLSVVWLRSVAFQIKQCLFQHFIIALFYEELKKKCNERLYILYTDRLFRICKCLLVI